MISSEKINIVKILDSIFREFDNLCSLNRVQKIEVNYYLIYLRKKLIWYK